MSRKLIGTLTAIVALNCVVVWSTLVWPNMAKSTASQPASAGVATADVDHGVAEEAAQPQRAYIPAFLTMIDFERVFTGENALPRREYVPVVLTAIDFEQAFAGVTAARRNNTPPNREKLRNAGWKRILGPG